MLLLILSRLPVTSRIRSKYVCRSWRSLVEDNPESFSQKSSPLRREDPCVLFHCDYPLRSSLCFVDFSYSALLLTLSFLQVFASFEEILVRAYRGIMNLVFILGVLLCFPLANAKTASPPSPSPFSPAPAPAPAPDYVNLTNLLTVAGPFHKFLSYLISTKVIDTFQSQANNTEEGVTIFVPKDSAFSSQKNPSLANLTQDQLKSLLLFHGLTHYYTLANFAQLSQSSPVNTFAGGGYSINFTDNSGTVHLSSGWAHTKISSSVHSTNPVAVYQIDKVLLPEAIYGTDIPPTPAPAPAPDVSPVADAPSGSSGGGSTASSSKNGASSKHKVRGICSTTLLGASLGLLMFI